MFVFPEASVMDGVVASVTVTAPESWLAPLEVLKVPEPPEKSFDVAPLAVRPAFTASAPPEIVNPPVAVATVIFAVPSKETPPMVLAFWRAVAVPAFPETVVWSPVFVPEIDEAPAPIVKTEVLAALAVKVRVPVLTVSAVLNVAFVTAPAVKLDPVPEIFVPTRVVGVPRFGVVKVIPANVRAAELLFKATEVVPINVDELLAALSPVLDPEIDEAPAPRVKTEVLAALPVSVTVPVFTVRPVVKVALVTEPAVSPEAVPVKLVATPEEGVPNAPPETKLPLAVPVRAPTNVVALTVLANVAL